MKPYLETTVLKFKDLSEQPRTRYVLLLQGTNVVPQVSVAIDNIYKDENYVAGFRAGDTDPCVIIPTRSIEFAIFDRSVFDEINRETAIRMTTSQIDSLKDLRKELDPEAAADEEHARAVERAHLATLFGSIPKAEGNGTQVHGGQYL